MTMIERVARVMAVSQGQDFPDPVPSHGFYVALWDRYMEMARAAIQAMRDPTDTMKESGSFTGWSDGTGAISEVEAAEVWHDMIDAALSETSEEP